MNENRVRSFLALPLPEAATARVQDALTPLQAQPGFSQVRWVAPRNWHLTLAFLGDQALDWLAGLETQLAWAVTAAALTPAPLRSRWISGFPDAKSRIVALELVPSPPLSALKTTLDAALLQQGFSPESRRFRPHITLGRVRQGGQVHFNPLPCDVTVPMTALTLYQSTLTAQGSEYQPVWSLPLPVLPD